MNTFKAALIAIIEFFKIFGPLLTLLVKGLVSLITFIVDYLTLRTKRLREQVDYERQIRRKALEEQKLKEDANVAAFNGIIEESWKIRYDNITKLIKENKYAEVLKLTDTYDNAVVDDVLFDISQSPEYRAMRIIKKMKEEEK